ncbi:MAG: thiosulfate oxidation carrier complex protein SoxZ [Acidobacteria bacterium]|nr:thiosulfate oxidation carrier complex protein SoxZ [Acidobacteriota bacterium]
MSLIIMKRIWILSVLLLSRGLVAPAQDVDILDATNRRLAALLEKVQSNSDSQHTPRIKAPRVVETANEVMVTVSVPLAGDEKHHIRRLALFDENSVVKLKYVATFSPAVRQAQVTVAIKMAKSTRLKAIAECSLHGKWLGISSAIEVGVGGCGAGQEPTRKLVGEVLRVRFQEIGELVQANMLFRHPMLSGYVMNADGRIAKSYDPFFLKSARVIYRGQPVAEFEIGPGLSDNPQIAILLPRLGNEPLRAEAINSVQQQFMLMARIPQ